MVPCISRIARPEGVWRRLGRELGRGEGDVGRMCSGIVGMLTMAMQYVDQEDVKFNTSIEFSQAPRITNAPRVTSAPCK